MTKLTAIKRTAASFKFFALTFCKNRSAQLSDSFRVSGRTPLSVAGVRFVPRTFRISVRCATIPLPIRLAHSILRNYQVIT